MESTEIVPMKTSEMHIFDNFTIISVKFSGPCGQRPGTKFYPKFDCRPNHNSCSKRISKACASAAIKHYQGWCQLALAGEAKTFQLFSPNFSHHAGTIAMKWVAKKLLRSVCEVTPKIFKRRTQNFGHPGETNGSTVANHRKKLWKIYNISVQWWWSLVEIRRKMREIRSK